MSNAIEISNYNSDINIPYLFFFISLPKILTFQHFFHFYMKIYYIKHRQKVKKWCVYDVIFHCNFDSNSKIDQFCREKK